MGLIRYSLLFGLSNWFRIVLLLLIGLHVLTGCSSGSRNSVIGDLLRESDLNPGIVVSTSNIDGPHKLWGEWTFFIDGSHENIQIVPARTPRFHLNALKFLEDYCSDCLEVVNLVNNGNSTIDLTIRLKHPFEGFPEYTGFDVKGIIMFEGSYTMLNDDPIVPMPDPLRISWRKLGDPEVLNPDGYTFRWSPNYDSGSNLPIFSYWEGKYANGTPTADLNAFRNFFSTEQRHIFNTDNIVTQTYTIWLPEGPIIAGYAVDACWEPPLVTPVTDPVTDFPLTANQPEYFRFELIINDNQPIMYCAECCVGNTCEDMYIEAENWGDALYPGYYLIFHNGVRVGVTSWFNCSPPVENRYPIPGFDSCEFDNGWYRGYAYKHPVGGTDEDESVLTFTIFDYYLDY
jgi:hypothetical protein